MKKFLLFLSAFIFSFFGHKAVAQPNSSNGKSLLWRVTSKNTKTPSYLFGTIHLICADDYVWTDAMEQSLHNSQEVCLELDMDDEGLSMQIAMGMLDTSGKKLSDYFTKTEYAKLKQIIADSLGMDIVQFEPMKPVVLQSILTSMLANCKTPLSYEANITEVAKKENKEVSGLETAAQQLELFDNMVADSVIKDINETVNDLQKQRSEYGKLVAVYRNQDLPKLHMLIQESKDIDLSGFLDSRNEKWIEKMVDKMDQHSTFFAVGAGHLWGNNGIINLLRKQGYTVEPMNK
ncbi:MAG: TraB/GumN family protein [Sphingobacteriales bacterium]|nr:MAG: TraB/GumN family protein [Sphingobacteriales bacterium]